MKTVSGAIDKGLRDLLGPDGVYEKRYSLYKEFIELCDEVNDFMGIRSIVIFHCNNSSIDGKYNDDWLIIRYPKAIQLNRLTRKMSKEMRDSEKYNMTTFGWSSETCDIFKVGLHVLQCLFVSVKEDKDTINTIAIDSLFGYKLVGYEYPTNTIVIPKINEANSMG